MFLNRFVGGIIKLKILLLIGAKNRGFYTGTNLNQLFKEDEIAEFKSGKTGIFSISVFAQKPSELVSACTPGGGCC